MIQNSFMLGMICGIVLTMLIAYLSVEYYKKNTLQSSEDE